jgi:hypothetical protein
MARTLAFCGFAVALMGMSTLEAAAQSSCSAEKSLCLSRGGGARCAERMVNCRATGCWEHIPKYGGRICSLKKS